MLCMLCATPLLVKVCIPELFYYLTVLIFSDSGCYGDYYAVFNLNQRHNKFCAWNFSQFYFGIGGCREAEISACEC